MAFKFKELDKYYYNLTQEEKLKYYNDLGCRLLEHRYRYYHLDDSVLSDAEYDFLERTYEAVSTDLKLHNVASDMVGFDYRKPGAQEAAIRVDSETDHYSLWLKEMKPIWERLGPPSKLQKKEDNDQ